jgi:predicted RNase H-like HicB family nuclease
MGQLVEWPEVFTEGKDLEECRAMLRDALYEMVAAYKQLDRITANEICKQAGLSRKF